MTPKTTAYQASLSFTLSWSWLKPTSAESMMLFNHLILCCPLHLLPSILPSIRVFSNVSALQIRYWSFSFIPSNIYSELISFKIDLLPVQGTLKSLVQKHNLKASILQHSAFLILQLSHPYVTTILVYTKK